MQVRLINVGSRPANMSDLVKAHPSLAARSPHELRVRSRPLLESNAEYVSEVVPSWRTTAAPPADSLALRSLRETLAQGSEKKQAAGGRAVGRLEPAGGGKRDRALDALRRALRSEEERKVDREARLRHLGISFARPLPEHVRRSHVLLDDCHDGLPHVS
jgi:hypothetical protein